jgi:small conductance mechanosensitive channel
MSAATATLTLAVFSDRYDRLFWGVVTILLAYLLSTVLKRIVMRLQERRPGEERELLQLRRRETAIVLVATAIPYVTAIIVLVVLASLFLPTAAALGGSALILVVVGFAAQRFLMDVIAGSFIALERWYGVGDFVILEPAKATGLSSSSACEPRSCGP